MIPVYHLEQTGPRWRFIALVVGEILQRTGSYVTIFIIAGSAYLLALGVIHTLSPRLDPATV